MMVGLLRLIFGYTNKLTQRMRTALRRNAPITLLWLGLAAWALVFSVATVYKLHSFWMGFDLGTHEQVIWNTLHGRFAASSPTRGTASYWGVDIILTELLFALPYALWQRPETLLVLQTLVTPLGAIPLYRLARRKLESAWAGVVWAALYLLALPIQFTALYEFQIRIVGTVFFLWAWWYLEERRWWRFVVCALLALGTRSDAGFALAGLGMYAALERRGWRWSVLPIVVGVGWIVLCSRVLVPAFRTDESFFYGFLYAWLGDTPGAMLRTVILRPGYVAAHIFTSGKLRYVLELGGPLLFLFVFQPRIALIALPSFALNLLSNDRIHWSVRYHYQSFVLPWLLIATLYAVAALRRRPRWRRWWPATLAAVLVATLASNVISRSPLINLATRPRSAERIARMAALVAAVPPDVALTTTSSFGPHLARRQALFFFPGNIIYPPDWATRGCYWLLDKREMETADLARITLAQQAGWRIRYEDADFVALDRCD